MEGIRGSGEEAHVRWSANGGMVADATAAAAVSSGEAQGTTNRWEGGQGGAQGLVAGGLIRMRVLIKA